MKPILHLLGGTAIEIDDAVVTGPETQRHRLALLALLAASPHRALSRDKLVGFLWPDHGQEDARHLLRQAVYVIRRELGEDVLESAGEQVVLDAEALPVDLHAFERALERGEFERAVDLYGGSFLDGFHLPGADEFERWVERERRRIDEAYGDALRTRAEEAEAAGRPDEAASWWGRLAAHDPYDSSVVLRLAGALAASGDRGGALRCIEEHATFLRRELDAPPDPELAELAERLRTDATSVVGTPSPEPSTEPGVSPTAGRFRLWAGLAGTAVLVAVALFWLASRDPGPPRSEDLVAVMPFEVRGDQRFAFLGEGMVDLLSSKVEGAGRLRSVDPRALLSFLERWAPRESGLDRGRAVAREFGAGYFVAGTVVAAGDRLEVHGVLYDAEGNARVRLPPVTGVAEDVFAIVDRLARGVVASRYETEGERLSSLAATTTSSMPALRSYLAGEAAFRAGHFDQAVEEFRRATEQDTTFALAWYRLAVAEEWSLDLDAAQMAVAHAVRHAARLAERDRLLFDAWEAYFSGAAVEAERLYGRILEAHPEDVEAWFYLGEVKFHYGPSRGRSIAGSTDIFRRVLELEPDHEGALLHLARIAARAGRPGEIDSLARRLQRSSELAVEMQTLAAFASRDSAAQRRVVGELAELDANAVFTAIWSVSYADPVGGTERLARILTEPTRPPDVRCTGHLLLATAALASGRLRDAREALALADRDDPDRALPIRALYATLPFLPSPPRELEEIRSELREWNTESVPTRPKGGVFLTVHDGLHRHLKEYLTSLLAERAGAEATSLEAMQRLERMVEPERAHGLSRDLALGARAAILDRANAAEALASLEQIRGEFPYEMVVVSPFFALSRERFAQAELLRAADRRDEALGVYGSFVDTSLFDLPYRAPAHLAQGEILDELGEVERALCHYRRFIDLWKDSDPVFHPIVDRARERVAEMATRKMDPNMLCGPGA